MFLLSFTPQHFEYLYYTLFTVKKTWTFLELGLNQATVNHNRQEIIRQVQDQNAD